MSDVPISIAQKRSSPSFHLPPRLLLTAGALLIGSILAIFGSLLLEMLRTAG